MNYKQIKLYYYASQYVNGYYDSDSPETIKHKYLCSRFVEDSIGCLPKVIEVTVADAAYEGAKSLFVKLTRDTRSGYTSLDWEPSIEGLETSPFDTYPDASDAFAEAFPDMVNSGIHQIWYSIRAL